MVELSRVHRFYFRRLGWYALTFVIAIVINFTIPLIVELKTGETAADRVLRNMDLMSLSMNEATEIREKVMQDFYLDHSVPVRFIIYLKNIITFNFGYSVANYPMPVWHIMYRHLGWTLLLQIPAIIGAYFVGNILGAFAAYKRKTLGHVIYPVSLLFSATPYFSVALIMVYVFGVKLHWFPPMGAYGDGTVIGFNLSFLLSVLYHYFLPFISLFLVLMGSQAMAMRSMALHEMGSDYVRYSQQMGLSDTKVVRYVFRNAILPQLTSLALAFGLMVAGTLLIEIIFSYPGIGVVLFDAVHKFDLPIIQAIVIIVTVNVLLLNFLIDILIVHLDPQVKAALQGRAA